MASGQKNYPPELLQAVQDMNNIATQIGHKVDELRPLAQRVQASSDSATVQGWLNAISIWDRITGGHKDSLHGTAAAVRTSYDNFVGLDHSMSKRTGTWIA